jgi:hypothetical protein
MAHEDWDVVRLLAIAEADEGHRVETVFGQQCFPRKVGEALHPEREPPERRGPQATRPEPLSVMARRLGILRSLY